MRAWRAASVALLVGLALVVPAFPGASSGLGYRPTVAVESVGPGTLLMRIHQAGRGGPIKALVLKVNLTDPAVRAGLLYPGIVAGVRTLSAMAGAAGAFAAVNGDYFNIGETGAPVGPMVSGGRLIKAPQPGRALAAGVGEDGVGRISTVALRGVVDLPSVRAPLADLNDANPGYPPMVAPNGIALFTPAWGSAARSGAVRGLRSVAEVLVHGGRVAHISARAGDGPIRSGGYVLLGAGSGGRMLARLRIGHAVSISYGQRTAAPVPFRFAVGGKYRLLRAGAVQSGLPVASGAERTAVGFSDGGRTMWLVATASREAGVPGLDLPELAAFARGLGVRDAVNLDDGGSTTIVVRQRGHTGLTLLNRPADHRQRRVANGVGLFATIRDGPKPSAARAARGAGYP